MWSNYTSTTFERCAEAVQGETAAYGNTLRKARTTFRTCLKNGLQHDATDVLLLLLLPSTNHGWKSSKFNSILDSSGGVAAYRLALNGGASTVLLLEAASPTR